MYVEEFVYNATNLVMIAGDGFSLPFVHFLLSLKDFFFCTWLEKVLLHQSQGICSGYHQIMCCHIDLYCVLWEIYTSIPQYRKSLHLVISSTTIAVLLHWCFHYRNIIKVKHNIFQCKHLSLRCHFFYICGISGGKEEQTLNH